MRDSLSLWVNLNRIIHPKNGAAVIAVCRSRNPQPLSGSSEASPHANKFVTNSVEFN